MKWSEVYATFLLYVVRFVCTCISLLVSSCILMLAWNWVIPHTFSLPALNLLQAFCLGVVSRSLLIIKFEGVQSEKTTTETK